MARIGGRIDDFTDRMLEQLIQHDEVVSGRSSKTKILIELIREEHFRRFPHEYSNGVWKDYKYFKQTA